MSTELKIKNESLRLDKNYKDFLNGIKDRLRAAQIRAAQAANKELVSFYWQLGIELIEKQRYGVKNSFVITFTLLSLIENKSFKFLQCYRQVFLF